MTMPTFDFGQQRVAWSKVPVDDVDYVSSHLMLQLADGELREIVRAVTLTRFDGWRNHGNRWVTTLRLDTTWDKDVVDFGCGVGIEALTYARHGNRVTLVDIVDDNVRLAERVLALHGHLPALVCVAGDRAPFVDVPDGSFDVFHCSGVLHHIPYARAVVEDAWRLLRPGGELRLMLYSDRGWRHATDDSEPPDDVASHPRFADFVRYFDQVGVYADWYDRGRLGRRFGDLFEVVDFAYLTPWDNYCAAVLVRRNR